MIARQRVGTAQFWRQRLRALLAALLLPTLCALTLTAMPGPLAPSARALSCVPVDIHDELNRTEFAFIGTPQVQAAGAGAGAKRWLFDVDVWVKGNLGTPVAVDGWEWSDPVAGTRMGMVVSMGQEGALRMSDCVGVHPDTLLAIAEAADEVPSSGPAVLLVGGEFGAARVMALDAFGRLVGYGPGQGSAVAMTACPGGRRTVEFSQDWLAEMGTTIAVRDVASLEIISEVRLPNTDEGFAWPGALVCRDEDGTDVLFGLPGVGVGQLGSEKPLVEGGFTITAIGPEFAVAIEPLNPADEGRLRFRLDLIELATGDVTVLRDPDQPAEPISFAFSPGGSHLALMERPPYGAPRGDMLVHVFDVHSAELVGTQRVPTPPACDGCWGVVTWADEGQLIVSDRRWDEGTGQEIGSVRLFEVPGFELLAEIDGGIGFVGRAAGGLLLTIEQLDGVSRLRAASLDGARVADLRILPTNTAASLLTLPSLDESASSMLLGQASPPPPGAGPAAPSPTDGQTGSQPPTMGGPPATDLVLPAALAALVLLVALGGTVIWRRRRTGG